MQPIMVITTCATTKEAETIATHLLEKRLVACVQINGPVTSSYWWQDGIAREPEYQVIMKSVRSLFNRLAEQLTAVHPYDVPEIIAMDMVAINGAYRDWLIGELDHG